MLARPAIAGSVWGGQFYLEKTGVSLFRGAFFEENNVLILSKVMILSRGPNTRISVIIPVEYIIFLRILPVSRIRVRRLALVFEANSYI